MFTKYYALQQLPEIVRSSMKKEVNYRMVVRSASRHPTGRQLFYCTVTASKGKDETRAKGMESSATT